MSPHSFTTTIVKYVCHSHLECHLLKVTDKDCSWGLIFCLFCLFTPAYSSTFCSALVILNLVPGLIQLLPFSQGINTMVCISLSQALKFSVFIEEFTFLPSYCSSLHMSVLCSGPQGSGKYLSQEKGTLSAAGPSWIVTCHLCYTENGWARDSEPQSGCLVHAGS